MVEFALIAPILLLILLGIVEFGRAWNAHQVITDAAREGARSAVIANPLVTTDSTRRIIANALSRAGLDPTAATIDLVEGTAPGDPTTVRITYPWFFGFLQPFMGWTNTDASIELKTEAVMRTE